MSDLRPRVGEREGQLQTRAAVAMAVAHVPFRAEVKVGRGRIDFLCAGGLGVELKVGSESRARLPKQTTLYLSDERVRSLLIVSEHRVPRRLRAAVEQAAEKCSKPVEIIELARAVAV